MVGDKMKWTTVIGLSIPFSCYLVILVMAVIAWPNGIVHVDFNHFKEYHLELIILFLSFPFVIITNERALTYIAKEQARQKKT